jgi:hypothetical protein
LPIQLTHARAALVATRGIGPDWYDRLDAAEKDAVRDQRLSEQGFLCGYTEFRLSSGRFHLEHMYPQDYCTPEEKIAYCITSF